MIKQKLIGVGLMVIGIVTSILATDITIGVLFVPLGLYAIFTHEDIIGGDSHRE